jgi:hypothetical protein
MKENNILLFLDHRRVVSTVILLSCADLVMNGAVHWKVFIHLLVQQSFNRKR